MIDSKLKAIVAVSPEGIIAIDGDMPWHVSEDLKRFKRLTINNVVIYGRKTFETFGKKPLPHRENFIISKSMKFKDIEGTSAFQFFDIDYAISNAKLMHPTKDIWIAGGASIYKQTLSIVDEIYLTIIKKDQIDYSGKNRLYLDDYPSILNSLFSLKYEEETEQAVYKTYQRKASNFRYQGGAVFSKTFS